MYETILKKTFGKVTMGLGRFEPLKKKENSPQLRHSRIVLAKLFVVWENTFNT